MCNKSNNNQNEGDGYPVRPKKVIIIQPIVPDETLKDAIDRTISTEEEE